MPPLLPIQPPKPFSGPPIPLVTLSPILVVALLKIVEDMANLVEVVIVLVLLMAVVLNGIFLQSQQPL